MRTERELSGKLHVLVVALILAGLAFFIEPAALFAAKMGDYCLVPPYVKKDIDPNIMIIMDNASGMTGRAYSGTYSATTTYEGYFSSTLYYTYTSRFEPDCGTPGVTADCPVGATADPGGSGRGLYYGNVLNWALTSRYDLLQKILVGGISTSRTSNVNTLISKSGSWTAILKYDKADGNGTRECKFEVDNANVVIRDGDTYTCGYLDTTPRPYEPGNTIVAFLGTDTFKNAGVQERQDRSLTARFLRPLAEKTLSLVSYIMGVFAGDAEAAKPVAFAGGTGTLASGTMGIAYSVTISASGGAANYSWSVTSGSLPAGLSIGLGPSSSSDTTISGTPTAAGTSTFTVTITDQSIPTAGSDSKTYSITIAAAVARGGALPGDTQSTNMNVKVCIGGSYTTNCNTTGYGAGTNSLKSGIIDEFWTQARFGLMDFNAQAGVASSNISQCIVNSTEVDRGTTPSPTFLTNIENAVPIDPVTPLVDAIWTAVDYFATETTGSTCDPFKNAQACLKNFILVISDGTGSNQLNYPDPSDHAGGECGGGNNPYVDATNCGSANFANLAKNSCFGYQNDLRSSTCGFDDKGGKQYASTYVVNTMGTAIGAGYNADNAPQAGTAGDGERLNQAALKGGGNYYGVTDASQLKQKLKDAFGDMIKRAAAGTAASVLASGEGSGANLIQAVFYPAKKFYNSATSSFDEIKWTGRLTNLWYYVDPFFTTSTIRADGGDKILNLDTDLGNDYITQLYYDTTNETTKAHRWEDTTGDGVVDTQLADVEFEALGNLWEAGTELWKRDITVAATKRKIYTTTTGTSLLSGNFSQDTNDNGSNTDNVDTDNAATLRPYFGFTDANDDPADDWKDDDFNHGGVIGDVDARTLIRYVHGEDVYTWLRSRTVKVDLNSDGDTLDTGETVAKVWKLGDILNSTPKISSWLPLNTYHKVYDDTTYGEADIDPSLSNAADSTHYITSSGYKNRNMVYAGANDGMLHAFKLGTLGLQWASKTSTQQATLGKHCSLTTYRPCNADTDCPTDPAETCATDTDLGKEMWAFIPKNALPYLKYTAYKDYCHTFSIDMTPYIFDASIKFVQGASNGSETNGQAGTIYETCTTANDSVSTFDYWKCIKSASSWRTILIGGMRYGGACKYSADTCTKDIDTDGFTTTTRTTTAPIKEADCVKSPVTDNGLSSYFALDITDQNKPTLLWEFTNAGLGFTTSGPAIVRINARKGDPPASPTTSIADDYHTTNGRWFVVFGSGPTGPVNSASQQFLGRSDQNLKLFVLDLKTGTLVRTIDATQQYIDAGAAGTAQLENAFAGSMLNASHDIDQDYQDDILYIPYVKAEDATLDTTTRWTEGGVLRLITNEELSGTNLTGSGAGNTALNPDKWVLSKLIDDTGPINSSVVRLQNQNTNTLWLYFGAGRYFYEIGATSDDPDTTRNIYGVTEPCFSGGASFNTLCTDADATNDLTRTVSGGSGLSDQTTETTATITNGWKISLDATGVPSGYKAERVITDPLATSSGVVFFTTYKPYSDECALGGKSFIWATKYDTGGAAGTLLKGKALIQVSTGSIEQMDMSTAFSEKGGRRTSAMEGVPPTAQGLSIVSTPPALKRVLHIRQR